MATATHLNIAVCLVVLTCLLHSTISEHSKKTIIVKVPHVIKHIHHQHYKPVHVHKAHAKKVEHHHHDTGEEKWEHKGHHGSFSHVKPVVEPADHLDSGESSVEQGNSREGQGYDVEDFQEQRHQNPWRAKNTPRNKRPKHNRDDRDQWSSLLGLRGSRDIFTEDNMFGSEEDFSGHREVRHRANSQKNQRSKQKKNEASQNMDESGWRPLMNFGSFKDVDDVWPNYRGRHHDQYIHSGEDQAEENTRDEGDYHEVSHSKKKRKQRKNKKNLNKSKWNKEIKVHDESSEEKPEVIVRPSKSYKVENPAPLVAQVPVHFIPLPVPQQVQIHPHQQRTIQQQPLLQQQLQHQQIIQLPQAVHQPIQQIPQNIPQSIQQHFKQPSEQPIQPLSAPTHAQHSSWPASQHATSQTQQSSWPAASSQQVQVQHQWQSQPSSSLTTQSPKVSVWTGHHLKLPKHSMWQVQQHSVSASSVPANPIQMLTVTHDSSAHPPAPPQNHFSQLTEASQAVHKVVAPTWPHTHSSFTQDQQGSPATQVWQQSVQNAGSAYTMEVVNFGTQKNRQK